MALPYEDGQGPLIDAVKNNNVENVKQLLSEKYDVNYTDHQGNTGLIWAAMLGHLDCLSVLLSHPDIDVNIQNDWKDSALFVSTQTRENENKEIFSLLIDHPDIDVNLLYDKGDEENGTILTILVEFYCAGMEDGEERLFKLLSKGFYFDPDLNRRPSQVAYSLVAALAFKKLNLVKFLLEIGGWRMIKISAAMELYNEDINRLLRKYVPPTLAQQSRNFIRETVYENGGFVCPNPALRQLAEENQLPLHTKRALLMEDRSLFMAD